MAYLVFTIYLISLAVSSSAFAVSLLTAFLFKNRKIIICALPVTAVICSVFGLCHHMSFPSGYVIQWTDPDAYDPSNMLTAVFALLFSAATMVIVLKNFFNDHESFREGDLRNDILSSESKTPESDLTEKPPANETPVPGSEDPGVFRKEIFDMVQEEFGLTDRETELCSLICEGKSNPDIANELYISENTVKTHIYNLFKKTDVSSRMELAALVAVYADPAVISGK